MSESEQGNMKGFLEVEIQKQKDLVMNAIAVNKEIKEIDSLVTKLCKSLGIDLAADQIGDSTKAHSRPRKKSR